MIDVSILTDLLLSVARRTTLFPGRQIRMEFIVNMNAGALYSAARAEQTIRTMVRLAEGLRGPVRPESELAIRFQTTRYPGHAHELATSLLDSIEAGSTGVDSTIIVSVGGDGTHAEILSAFGPDRTDDNDLYFLRLPLGTGNDGADAPDLPSAVRLLLGEARPVRTGELVVQPEGMGEFSAYNIGSIGLDAYIAYLTNRLRGRFKGDAYKVIADVMTLFYERIVGSAPVRIEYVDAQGDASSLADEFLLVAIGVSGYRRYGGGKLVLPGYENLCAISRLGTIGKIRLKAAFYKGEHVERPQVRMRSIQRATIYHEKRIPMQLDGESVWLDPEHFPLRVAVRSARIPVLVFDQSNT